MLNNKSTYSAGNQLREILRKRIILNDLKPGEKISEAETAAYYKTSRQPVREAFIKLAEEGLIDIQPRLGSVITKIDCLSISDAQFIREAIEAEIVKELVIRSTPQTVKKLKKCIAKQKTSLNDDIHSFNALDRDFHQALADGAGKPATWQMIQPFKSQLDRIRFLTSEKRYIKTSIIQHEKVVEAVENRDIEMANAAIRIHVRDITQRLPRLQKKYPDFFTNDEDEY